MNNTFTQSNNGWTLPKGFRLSVQEIEVDNLVFNGVSIYELKRKADLYDLLIDSLSPEAFESLPDIVRRKVLTAQLEDIKAGVDKLEQAQGGAE